MSFDIPTGKTPAPEDFARLQGTPDMKALGALASAEAADGLTKAEQNALLTLAKSMEKSMADDPKLPPANVDAIKKWITYLQNYPAQNAPEGIDMPTFNNVPPAKNPWMTPGFVVALAIVLSKLEAVMDKVIMANSK